MNTLKQLEELKNNIRLILKPQTIFNLCESSELTEPHIDLFLEINGDFNYKNHKGMSFLDIACKWGHLNVVKLLVYKCKEFININNALMNCINYEGVEESHFDKMRLWDYTNDRLKVFEFLIEQGADINYQDENGWTPLMKSCLYNNYKIFYFLYNKKANKFIINKNGKSAVDIAIEYNREQMSFLLLETDEDKILRLKKEKEENENFNLLVENFNNEYKDKDYNGSALFLVDFNQYYYNKINTFIEHLTKNDIDRGYDGIYDSAPHSISNT